MSDRHARDEFLAALAEVAPVFDPAEIDPQRNLAEQLDFGFDDFLDLVVAVGRRTGIEVPEQDYGWLMTLDGAVAYLAVAEMI